MGFMIASVNFILIAKDLVGLLKACFDSSLFQLQVSREHIVPGIERQLSFSVRFIFLDNDVLHSIDCDHDALHNVDCVIL